MARRPNIFHQLAVDHEKQRRLLSGILCTAAEDEARLRLVEELCEELRAHAAAEEQTFYAELLSHSRDAIEQSVAANDEVEELILQLDELDCRSADWGAIFARLKTKVEDHLDWEERLLFPRARKHIKAKRAAWLAERFAQVKEHERALGSSGPFGRSSTELRHAVAAEPQDRPALAAAVVSAKG